jgi:hypothetical protein
LIGLDCLLPWMSTWMHNVPCVSTCSTWCDLASSCPQSCDHW